MFMLLQTSVKMAFLLHKQASDRFHSLLTVCVFDFVRLCMKQQLKGWGKPTTTMHKDDIHSEVNNIFTMVTTVFNNCDVTLLLCY